MKIGTGCERTFAPAQKKTHHNFSSEILLHERVSNGDPCICLEAALRAGLYEPKPPKFQKIKSRTKTFPFKNKEMINQVQILILMFWNFCFLLARKDRPWKRKKRQTHPFIQFQYNNSYACLVRE